MKSILRVRSSRTRARPPCVRIPIRVRSALMGPGVHSRRVRRRSPRARTRPSTCVRIPIRVSRSALMRASLHSWRVGGRGSVRLLRQGRLRRKPHQQSQRESANDSQPLHLSAVIPVVAADRSADLVVAPVARPRELRPAHQTCSARRNSPAHPNS